MISGFQINALLYDIYSATIIMSLPIENWQYSLNHMCFGIMSSPTQAAHYDCVITNCVNDNIYTITALWAMVGSKELCYWRL